MDQLKDSNNSRREMVANVSHDLRTPLAALRGYVETLLLKEKEITLKTDIEKEMPLTHADIGLIERVLENLLENAINYTPGGGTVGLSIKLVNDEISVAVSDTGTGIPEAEIPHIFGRFYRMNRGRRQGDGHHGLGLAIAKRILELHQRSIHVQSLLNYGTTLSFNLPAFPTV